jgi:hypothetical protein
MRPLFLNRSLPFLLFLGWWSVSCVCSLNPAVIDEVPSAKPDGQSSPQAATQTWSVVESLLSDSYRVAVFPSGAEIRLMSPQNEEIVRDPWVDVVGAAPAETVITLNDEIAVAGADGMFYGRVPLEQGLNEIQCTASNLEGDEVAFSILVVFEPEED